MKLPHVALAAVLTCGLSFAGAPAKDKALLDKGKTSFTTNCVACHGEKGDGSGPAAAALNPKPRNFAKETFKQGEKVEDVFKTLAEGVKGTTMVAFNYLPENDRWALSYWVLELKGAGKPAAVAPAPAPAPAKK